MYLLLHRKLVREGKYEEGNIHIEEGLSIVNRIDYQQWASNFINMQASIALYQGRYLEARQLFVQAITLAEKYSIGLKWAWSELHLAIVECVLGNYEDAKTSIERVSEAAQSLNKRLLHCALSAEGLMLLLTKDPQTATPLVDRLRQAASRYEEGGGHSDFAKWYYAEYFRRTGDYQKAYDLWKENLHAWRFQSRATDQANMAHSLAVLFFDMGDLNRARTQAKEAIALYNAINHNLGRASAQTTLAEIELTSGSANKDETYELLRQASLASYQIGAKPTTLHSFYVLSNLLSTGNVDEQRQAVELLDLVLNHSSTTWETRQKAKQLLALLAAELPTIPSKDVSCRPSVLDLERAVYELQATQTDLDPLA